VSADPYSDLLVYIGEEVKIHKKTRNCEISCFGELYVLPGELEASPGPEKFFSEARRDMLIKKLSCFHLYFSLFDHPITLVEIRVRILN
jgi:hypothetical protein